VGVTESVIPDHKMKRAGVALNRLPGPQREAKAGEEEEEGSEAKAPKH
jgi:hypothetical protein